MIIDSGVVTGSLTVSGSFNQQGNAFISGNLIVSGVVNAIISGSIDSASYAAFASTATSASFAFTARSSSFALNATSSSYALVSTSGSYALTATSASQASNANTATSASYALNATNALTASYFVTSSVTSASFALNATSASQASNANTATSASQALNANTATSASYALAATSSSYAVNASTATSASQAANAITSSYAANADLLDGIDSTRFAVTSSNSFTGTQYVSATNNATSFTSTASIYTDGGLRVTKDAYVSGTIFVNNLTVYGTQSVNYITSSQLNIGTNIITVNTDVPSIRFGGLAVYDSGSTRLTGSMLWDSEDNHWVYSNPSGSSYDGGMMLSGPRNSSGLGNEQGVNNNAILKGQGGDHVTSSLITETGTATTFYTNALYVTSSNFVGIGTTSPAATLDVNGKIYSRSSDGIFSDAFTAYSGGNLTLTYGAAGSLIFNGGSGGATRMRLDSTGNLGLGVTPSAYSLGKAVEVGTLGNSFWGVGINSVQLTSNYFYDGSYKYANNGFANRYDIGSSSGIHAWFNAASGTAGNAISFTQAMTLGTNSGLSIGTTTVAPANGILTGGVIQAGSYFYNSFSTSGFYNAYFQNTSSTSYGLYSQGGSTGKNALTIKSYGGTDYLTIDGGTGAATFSNSVTGTQGVNVGANALGTDRMFQVSGTAFTSGASQFGAVINPTMGTLTTLYGIYVGTNCTSATNSYAIYVEGSGGTVTNKYGIYQSGGSDKNYFAGNVGIGTTSPTGTKLDIRDDSANSIRWGSTSTQYGFTSWDTNLAIIGSVGASTSIGFWTNGTTERMRITSGGNVLIGTTTDSGYKLDVNGNGRFAGTLAIDANSNSDWAAGINNLGTTSANGLYVNIGAASTGKPFAVYKNFSQLFGVENSGAATFASSVTATSATLSGSASDRLIMTRTGIGTYHLAISGDDRFSIYDPSADAERLSITSAGNVGIGTSSPSQKLDVNGYARATSGFVGNSGLSLFGDNSSSSAGLFVTTSGNVGIGTTSPGTKLQVNSTAGNYGITNTNGTVTIGTYIEASNTYASFGTSTNHPIGFFTNNNAPQMYINTSGNVGIGTTSPGSILEIYQATPIFGINGTTLDAYRGIELKHNGETLNYYKFNASSGEARLSVGKAGFGSRFTFYADAAEVMRINSSGNVLIGTTTDSGEKLQVVGSAYINSNGGSDSYPLVVRNALLKANNNYLGIKLASADASSLDGNIVLFGGSSKRLEIAAYDNGVGPANVVVPYGNLGIGTTAPSAKVHVAGGSIMLSDTTAAGTSVGKIIYKQTNSSGFDIAEINGIAGATVVEGILAFNTKDSGGTMSERMRITSAGSVGIGTSSPNYKLEVNGSVGTGVIVSTSDSTEQIVIRTSTNTDKQLTFGRTADYGQIFVITQNVGYQPLALQPSGGNVGIGTTSPAYKLHIVTDAVAGRQNMSNISRTTGNWVRFTNPQYSTDASMGLILRVFPDNDSRQGAGIIASGGVSNGVTDLDLFVSSGVGTSTSYSALSIKGDNGNVGIGTTSPTKKLQIAISDASHANEGILLSSSGGYGEGAIYHDYGQGNGLTAFKLRNLYGGSEINLSQDSYNAAGSPSSIMFSTSPSSGGNTPVERMRITSTGNVGIGTTSASHRLTVTSGNLAIESGQTYISSGYNIYFDYNVSNNYLIRKDGTNLLFNTGGSFAFSGGNVGINTTTPSSSFVLDVWANNTTYNTRIYQPSSSTSAYNSVVVSGAMTSAIAYFGVGGSAVGNTSFRDSVVIGSQTAHSLVFNTSDTERMRILSGGNIGINNTGLGNVKLYITGGDTTSSNFGILIRDSASSDTMWVRNDGAGYLKAAAWTYGSDIRMKENISYIETGLDKVLSLKPAKFDYIGGVKNNLGFIAQDIKEILPEAVDIIDKETGMLGLKTDFLVPYLVKAIQELKTELDILKNK